jgi:nucleoside-diphosphate-sugar epimerase
MTQAMEISNGRDVVESDLAYLSDTLHDVFSSLSGGRLLITGGAGFLGYYLVQAPLAWNDRSGLDPIEIVVVDNYKRGVPEWLGPLADRPDMSLLEHDMRDQLPSDLGDFNAIIHAAGIASPHVYRKYPIETMDANINGLRSLLDHAEGQTERGQPLTGFLFFSSSEIYGDPSPDAIPTPETYRGYVSCTGPRACYDESKRYGETLCVNFTRSRGVRTTIARPFNNFGPGMKINDGRVIADFCRSVIDGEDIVMFSDGSPMRTFCYVADAVAGYYLVLGKGRDGEPYNIGAAGPEIAMAELATRVREQASALFGYGGEVRLGASQEADYLVDNPNRRCPDISKARTDLGYEPAFDVDEGIRRTLLWYGDNRQGVAE